MCKKTDMEKNDDFDALKSKYDELQKKHFKQAYWFCFGILIVLSILAIAYLIVNKDDCYQSINRYVGFASTLLSIVMSIFAIMYTYTSNQQIGEKFKDIDNAAHEIHHTADMIRNEAANMNQRINNIQNQINAYLYTNTNKSLSSENINDNTQYENDNKKTINMSAE